MVKLNVAGCENQNAKYYLSKYNYSVVDWSDSFVCNIVASLFQLPVCEAKGGPENNERAGFSWGTLRLFVLWITQMATCNPSRFSY